MNSLSLDKLPVNWFDFTVVVVLLVGFARGRKNGLSQELLPMLQWLGMIFTAAYFYKPVGEFMASSTVFSLLFCYILCYFVIAIAVKIFFSLVKRALGGKLAGSDVFGRAEYYIGMPAGLIRFACIIIFLLSFVGARYYSAAELKAKDKYNLDVYGSNYWPTLDTVQQEIFQRSFLGPKIREYIGFMLIEPTAPAAKEIKRKEAEMP